MKVGITGLAVGGPLAGQEITAVPPTYYIVYNKRQSALSSSPTTAAANEKIESPYLPWRYNHEVFRTQTRVFDFWVSYELTAEDLLLLFMEAYKDRQKLLQDIIGLEQSQFQQSGSKTEG